MAGQSLLLVLDLHSRLEQFCSQLMTFTLERVTGFDCDRVTSASMKIYLTVWDDGVELNNSLRVPGYLCPRAFDAFRTVTFLEVLGSEQTCRNPAYFHLSKLQMIHDGDRACMHASEVYMSNDWRFAGLLS